MAQRRVQKCTVTFPAEGSRAAPPHSSPPQWCTEVHFSFPDCCYFFCLLAASFLPFFFLLFSHILHVPTLNELNSFRLLGKMGNECDPATVPMSTL